MESRSDGRKEKPPDGWTPCGRERRGGRGGPDWAVERENGPPGWARRGKGWAGEKVLGRREKKEKKGRGRWVGPKTIGNEREVFFFFFFSKEIQSIQFKFKFKRIQIQIGQLTIKQCISA